MPNQCRTTAAILADQGCEHVSYVTDIEVSVNSKLIGVLMSLNVILLSKAQVAVANTTSAETPTTYL